MISQICVEKRNSMDDSTRDENWFGGANSYDDARTKFPLNTTEISPICENDTVNPSSYSSTALESYWPPENCHQLSSNSNDYANENRDHHPPQLKPRQRNEDPNNVALNNSPPLVPNNDTNGDNNFACNQHLCNNNPHQSNDFLYNQENDQTLDGNRNGYPSFDTHQYYPDEFNVGDLHRYQNRQPWSQEGYLSYESTTNHLVMANITVDRYNYQCGNFLLHPNSPTSGSAISGNSRPTPSPGFSFPRQPVIRRRNTANRKERRRTQSINNAFSDLRDCIPNVPADTKLSKIKTLRLATSYISYLMNILSTDDSFHSSDCCSTQGFQADLLSTSNHSKGRASSLTNAPPLGHDSLPAYINKGNESSPYDPINDDANVADSKKSKGRTGWPQHVWALELKQEQL